MVPADLGYKVGQLPNAEKAASEVLLADFSGGRTKPRFCARPIQSWAIIARS